MKTIIFEIKITVYRINATLDTAEEKTERLMTLNT